MCALCSGDTPCEVRRETGEEDDKKREDRVKEKKGPGGSNVVMLKCCIVREHVMCSFALAVGDIYIFIGWGYVTFALVCKHMVQWFY
jgi:hypothetical protein